jgi:hypothetical protein
LRLLKDSGWVFKPTMISKRHVIAWVTGSWKKFALTLREFCVNQLCTVPGADIETSSKPKSERQHACSHKYCTPLQYEGCCQSV